MSVVGGSSRPLASGTDSVTTVPSGTQAVSGTVTANAGSGTMAVSAASLPLPSGAATAAKQPALGTAGTASTDVLSVQGIASGMTLGVTPAAGELHLGEVGGNSAVVINAPTISTSAYVAGYVVGAIQTLTNAMRKSGGTGVLQSLVVTEHGSQKAALDVLIFSANPTGTYTDHAACPTITQADLTKCIARISVAAADYVTVGASSTAIKSVGSVVAASGTANLYAVAVTTGTPTYAAATDLTFAFGFLRD